MQLLNQLQGEQENQNGSQDLILGKIFKEDGNVPCMETTSIYSVSCTCKTEILPKTFRTRDTKHSASGEPALWRKDAARSRQLVRPTNIHRSEKKGREKSFTLYNSTCFLLFPCIWFFFPLLFYICFLIQGVDIAVHQDDCCSLISIIKLIL